MAIKETTSIKLDPEVKFRAEQIAKTENRSVSNLVEYLLIREIESKKLNGFEFKEYVPYVPPQLIVVGKGKDESLAEQFEAITGAQL